MAGKVPTKPEIASAIETYCQKYPDLKIEKSYDEPTDSWHLKDGNDIEIIIGPGFTCTDASLLAALREIIMDARDSNAVESPRKATSQTDKAIMPSKTRNAVCGPLAKPDMPIRDIQVAELTFDDIKTYICPVANDQEVMIFLKLCQARNLNPFLRDAYLIKYDQTKAAQMVVGKDSFTKKAEDHPKFAGYKAGIIVKIGDVLERREGTFWMEGEVLVGGWAEVYRVDREKTPYKMEVPRKEYDTGKSNWVTKPATMIRKVALVQALREAFPSEFSGMYDQAEMGIDPEKEVKA
ncbi:phage recombination protein Bet [Candidatus Pacearchaeota archaeon]|jgi:phage recombination protein Bet|nr:phage recombination protein Bet [Candidatus Pacearchaeota archaeon]